MSGTSCTGNPQDDFANAKMHYNPNDCPHPYHIGDLPPLLENNGYAYMSVLINEFKIKDIIGKVIIIHDMPDANRDGSYWQNYFTNCYPLL